MSANLYSTLSCLFSTGASSEAGCGLMRVEVSFTATSRSASTDNMGSIFYKYGKNLIVRAIYSARVFVM